MECGRGEATQGHKPAQIAPVGGALFCPPHHALGRGYQFRRGAGLSGDRHPTADTDLGEDVSQFINLAGTVLVAGVFPWAGYFGDHSDLQPA